MQHCRIYQEVTDLLILGNHTCALFVKRILSYGCMLSVNFPILCVCKTGRVVFSLTGSFVLQTAGTALFHLPHTDVAAYHPVCDPQDIRLKPILHKLSYVRF